MTIPGLTTPNRHDRRARCWNVGRLQIANCTSQSCALSWINIASAFSAKGMIERTPGRISIAPRGDAFRAECQYIDADDFVDPSVALKVVK
jgi:hypothetical protein